MATSFQEQIFNFLLESQYFPPEQLRRQQVHQLEQLVRFAKGQVAFYKTRLNCLFDANDQFRMSHWPDVPILTRGDLHAHRDEMLTDQLPAGHGLTADHLGSGTTGKSVTTRHNGLISEVSDALYFRALGWHGIDYSKTLFAWFGGDQDVDRWPDGTMGTAWGPDWDTRSAVGKFCKLSRLDKVEHAIDFMLRHRPSYVTGRPNAMLELALETERRGLDIKLDAIISFSAQLTQSVRDECSRIFNAKIIDRYASKEVYDIAHQCPTSDHLHIGAEAMVFEVLNVENKPCATGTPGRVVVTPFYNTVQPFIRYDLGDIVTLGETCACGRNLPVILALNGRTIHLFVGPKGKRFSLRLPDLLRKTIGAMEWQVAQIEMNTVEIRYVKKSDAPQSAFAHLTEIIRSQMSPTTTVRFKPVVKLPETASGKVLEMVCELAPETV